MENVKFIPEASYFFESNFKTRLKGAAKTLGKGSLVTGIGAGLNRLRVSSNKKDELYKTATSSGDGKLPVDFNTYAKDFVSKLPGELHDATQTGAMIGAGAAGMAYGAKKALAFRKNRMAKLDKQIEKQTAATKKREDEELEDLRHRNNLQAQHNNY